MPIVHGQFINLKYDINKHRKVLDEDLQIQMRQAARAWLRATFTHVPMWTGMARSSLKPLGRYLRVAIPIEPNPKARPSPSKNIALGERQQEFEFDANGYNYGFYWSTHVLHYQHNEFHPSNIPLLNPTPWESTLYGQNAWDNYVANVLPNRIPKVTDFLHTSIITIERG